MTMSELTGLLVAHNIPFESWGKNGAKTISQLLIEIEKGDSALIVEDGQLVRVISTVTVDVFYKLSTGRKRQQKNTIKLFEDRQVFKDGTVRTRNLLTSVQEKMKPGEDRIRAARRALEEELGVKTYEVLIVMDEAHKREVSNSYPGLMTCNTLFHHVVYLDSLSFRPEGYVEVQDDKTNYFKWVLVRQ